jgi:hypothetical protein
MSRTEVAIYKDATIIAADIATDAIETAKIKDKNVTKAKLADDVVAAIAAAITTPPYPFTTRGFSMPI